MLADAILIAETKAWIKKAELDVRSASHDLTAVPPLVSDAVCHCQQAVAKVLKGFLFWHNVVFRKTNSLEEIGEQCLKIDQTLFQVIDQAVPLTEYAWKFRYLGDPEEPSLEEAAEALAIAKKVYTAILDRLPDLLKP